MLADELLRQEPPPLGGQQDHDVDHGLALDWGVSQVGQAVLDERHLIAGRAVGYGVLGVGMAYLLQLAKITSFPFIRLNSGQTAMLLTNKPTIARANARKPSLLKPMVLVACEMALHR